LDSALEHAMRNVEENKKGLELNGILLLLIYADNVNLFGVNTSIIKKLYYIVGRKLL
jgi:hypothetical protein